MSTLYKPLSTGGEGKRLNAPTASNTTKAKKERTTPSRPDKRLDIGKTLWGGGGRVEGCTTMGGGTKENRPTVEQGGENLLGDGDLPGRGEEK